MNEVLELLENADAKLKHAIESLTYEREVALAQQALVALGLTQTLVGFASTPHQGWRA